MKIAELKSITGLRFLAAFYVFVFHIDMRLPLAFLPGSVQAIIHQGRLGVTVFFILSGFVLTYSHLKDFPTTSFKGGAYYRKFIFRRIARLYPVYMLGLLLSVVISIPLGFLPSGRVLALYPLFLQVYLPTTAMGWYSAGSWSVANEFFFYLLFPLALPLVLRIRQSGWLLLLLVLLSAAGPGLCYLEQRLLNFGNAFIFAFPPNRFPDFLSGVVAAVLAFCFNWRASGLLVWALLAATASYVGLCYLPNTISYNWLVVPTVAALLMVLAQADNLRGFGWLRHRVVYYLGKTSYSFYIVQLPMLGLLDAVLLGKYIAPQNIILAPVFLAINLLVGIAVYELLEKPAQKKLLRLFISTDSAPTYLTETVPSITPQAGPPKSSSPI